MFLYGGYPKEVSSDKNSSEKELVIQTCGHLILGLASGIRTAFNFYSQDLTDNSVKIE